MILTNKFVYLDFEYIILGARHNQPVCCVLRTNYMFGEFWFASPGETERFREVIYNFVERDYIFVSFSAGAEWRSCTYLIPEKMPRRWLDVRIPCMEIYHSDSKYQHFIKQQAKLKKLESYQSLEAFCTYFDVPITQKADGLAKRIGCGDFTEADKEKIIQYCSEDVFSLIKLTSKFLNRSLDDWLHLTEHVINMESIACRGIPVKLDEIKKVSKNKGPFLSDLKSKCKFYKFIRNKYAFNNLVLKQWILENNLEDKWPKTEKSLAFETSTEALREFVSYPDIAELRKIKSFEKDLRGFSSENDKSIFASIHVEQNGCATQHPYYGTYGTISSRNAASASKFILAQPKWMRNLIDIPSGQTLVIADWKAQEVWIAATLSKDPLLLADYFSEDIYVSYAQRCGLIPQNITVEDPKFAAGRKIAKQVFLGKQYGMGFVTLGEKCKIGMDEAEYYSDAWNKMYWRYVAWQREKLRNHHTFKGSYNYGVNLYDCIGVDGKTWDLTIKNWFVQSSAAYMLRRAISESVQQGIGYAWTLHDELAAYVKTTHVGQMKDAIQICMNNASYAIGGTSCKPCKISFDTLTHGDMITEKHDHDVYLNVLGGFQNGI